MEKLPSEETFKKVFAGILAGVAKETEDKFGGIVAELSKLSMDEYNCFIDYQLGNCILAFHKSDDGAFIYEKYGYVEEAFTKYIESREGSCCCVDKSRTIVRGLHKAFEAGTPYVMPVREKDEQYWITRCMTTEDVIEFYKAIKSAYFGRHIKLVEFYLKRASKE